MQISWVVIIILLLLLLCQIPVERLVDLPETSIVTSSGHPKNDDDTFIRNLPYDNTSCEDNYVSCPIWANNGECEVNPEYMLFQCSKSCAACKYTNEDKARLDRIYNSKMPKKCIYHGSEYPSEFGYLNKLYDYSLSVGY